MYILVKGCCSFSSGSYMNESLVKSVYFCSQVLHKIEIVSLIRVSRYVHLPLGFCTCSWLDYFFIFFKISKSKMYVKEIQICIISFHYVSLLD